MFTLKEERNNKIRALYEQGVRQTEIAARFGIQQCRVSAIITRRRPGWRNCRVCKTRMDEPSLRGYCSDCIRDRKAERKRKYEEKKAADYAARQHALHFGERACRSCGNSFVGFKRWICDDCHVQSKEPKGGRECQICSERTGDMWAVCLKCCPFKSEVQRLEKKRGRKFEGRDRVRALVRARDEHKCRDCGLKRTQEEVWKFNSRKRNLKGKLKSLDVHHLDGLCGEISMGYDSALMIERLITLCHRCHFNRHDHSRNM